MRILPEHAANLDSELQQALEAEEGAVYAVRPDGVLWFTNSAYDRFALANDGADALARFPLGASVFDAMSPFLRAPHRDLLTHVIATAQPIHREYECPSPSQSRRFRMGVMPLPHGGAVYVNSLLVEADAPFNVFLPGRYVGPDGLVRVCAVCRRARRLDEPTFWDFVPALLERDAPAPVSHGLCPTCLEHSFPAGA